MSTDLPIGYNGMEPAEIPIEEKRVGFGKRLGASVLNFVIMALISVVIGLALNSMIEPYVQELIAKQLEDVPNAADIPEFATTFMRLSISFGLVGGCIGILMSLLEVFTGASVGKMILGIVVAHENGKRGTVSLWALRWLLKHLDSLISFAGLILAIKALSNTSTGILVIYVVGCFMVLGARRQGFHDMIAKTAVFEKEDITD
ncbi:MAG: RDD family protein [Candidatus Kapabacteria bacterium]|nr:RDD family protein [Candidatus Kapabacteria bacterium]MBX7153380.1 RDD family protein [Bacteroidota bacterium]